MRRAAVLGIVVMSPLFGCNRINPPPGPRLLIPSGREPLFFVPPAAYTVINAYEKNF
jgi:hypothetical protein